MANQPKPYQKKGRCGHWRGGKSVELAIQNTLETEGTGDTFQRVQIEVSMAGQGQQLGGTCGAVVSGGHTTVVGV